MCRLGGLSAVLVAAVLSPVAMAAPKHSCQLLVDPAYDNHFAGDRSLSSGSLDIVSADVASDDRYLTTVVRLRDLTDTRGAPTGTHHDVNFRLHEQLFLTSAYRAPDGVAFELKLVSESAGDANAGAAVYEFISTIDGSFDEDTGEIRMHVPAALMRRYGGVRGARIDQVSAVSLVYTGTTTGPPHGSGTGTSGRGTFEGTDNASTSKTYTGGQPSCVKPGP